jgi:predicted PurR-regulated permease PerM
MDEFKRHVIFIVAVCSAAVALLVLVWEARLILLLFFAGCIGALILATLTGWIQSWLRVRRMLAFVMALVAITTVLGLGAWLRGPAFVQQLGQLQTDIPEAAQHIFARLQAQIWGRWLIAYTTDSDQMSRGLSYAIAGIGGAMALTAATIVGLFVVLITSLYLAAEPDFYLRGFRRILPASVRPTIEACLASTTQMLRIWLLAKGLSMATIGVFVTIGLLVLRVPLAGTLGAIAGLLTFIPNLGPILSVLPAALLAFAISPLKGILTIALFCLAHLLEGIVVTPLVERKIVTLPPALTLTIQLLLATVAGALGVALAAPLTAVMLGCMKALLPPEQQDAPPS